MLRIRPGQDLENVIGLLRTVQHKAETLVLNAGDLSTEVARGYIEWAVTSQNLLRSAIHPEDVERLVTTRSYWAIIGALNSVPAVLVKNETQARHDSISEELMHLVRSQEEQRRWGWVTVAVLDTNVVLHRHSEILTLNWHELVEERPARRLRLIIPIVVVDELDRLKQSQGSMYLSGRSVPRRSVARQALRTLSSLFERGDEVIELAFGARARTNPSSLELLMDAPGHQRMPTVDAEIRDLTSSLGAFAKRSVLLTHDLGNALAARWSGLEAIRLSEPEDQSP